MGIELTTLTLPVTRILDENPLPMLGAAQPRPLRSDSLCQADREGLGRATGFRVLPYRMQDVYESQPVPRQVKAQVLFNEHLRATFLPEWGGRLYSLVDQATGRELLFRNPVIRLGNLALRDAWFSGGVEWNFGRFGHTCLTCEKVFFAEGRDEDGNAFLRMYEFERLTRMVFQVDFHLPPGARSLICHMRVYNPHEAAPLFLWTNTAVPAAPGARAFSGTDQVLLLRQRPGQVDQLLRCQLPDPLGEGIDHTVPENVPYSEEYFFQNAHDEQSAFEAYLMPEGQLFYERSTGNYPYRKVFLWGSHQGGKNWQDQLSLPGQGGYLEVQAGLFPTQQHAGLLGAGQVLSLTQMLGGCQVDAAPYQGDYGLARPRMAAKVEALLPPEAVRSQHARCQALAEKRAVRLLHCGSGWGALELRRDPGYLPGHLYFPEAALGPAQAPWLKLLEGQPFSGVDSFMTAPEWLPVLESAHQRQAEDAALAAHLGVALYENGERERAVALWAMFDTPLCLRNRAFAAGQAGDWHQAAALLERALSGMKAPHRAYCEEYLKAMNLCGQAAQGYAWYKGLPPALRAQERLTLLAAVGACAVGDDAFLDKVFQRRFSVVREGEVSLADLWMRTQARRGTHEPLPRHLDYGMMQG